MLIIPAIDLKDGCVVRYVQGRINKKIYSSDPLKTAQHWVRCGAPMLHVVDLDGAFTGEPKNIGIVKAIARSVKVPVQFGGGVRTLATVKTLIDAGVWRVVLGTKAVQDPKFLAQLRKRFSDKIIVSVDAKAENVMVEGWKAASKGLNAVTFAQTLRKAGFGEIIYTDTLKDGTLKGPNVLVIRRLMREAGVRVVASGGISCLGDLAKLKTLEKQGVTGVIIGKALYEGKFTLPEALRYS